MRRAHVPWALPFAVVGCVAVLTACTRTEQVAETSTTAPPPPATEAIDGGIDGPVVFTRPLDRAEDALVEGIVQVDDGCLRLITADHQRYALMWPAGTRWQAEPPAVVLPTGLTVSPGDVIRAGGGWHPVGRLDAYIDDPAATNQLERCGGDGREVVIVQGASRITIS